MTYCLIGFVNMHFPGFICVKFSLFTIPKKVTETIPANDTLRAGFTYYSNKLYIAKIMVFDVNIVHACIYFILVR